MSTRRERPPVVPAGAFVNEDGHLTEGARGHLQRVSKPIALMVDVVNLDSGTTYTADQLRNKIIEVLRALGASDP